MNDVGERESAVSHYSNDVALTYVKHDFDGSSTLWTYKKQ